MSGALDHRMALQRAHSIGRAEHELLDTRQERGRHSQVASSEWQRQRLSEPHQLSATASGSGGGDG